MSRIHLFAVLAAVLVLAAGCASDKTGQQSGVVTGSEFRLVDADGATRAVLALDNGNPVLRFMDRQGKIRTSLLMYEDGGSGLVFTQESGRPGASIGSNAAGPALAFGDGAGNVRALLTVGKDGTPKLVLKDTTGHAAWTAP